MVLVVAAAVDVASSKICCVDSHNKPHPSVQYVASSFNTGGGRLFTNFSHFCFITVLGNNISLYANRHKFNDNILFPSVSNNPASAQTSPQASLFKL